MDLTSAINPGISWNNTNKSVQNTTQFILREAPVFDELNLINVLVKGTMFIVSMFGNVSTIVQMYKMRRRKSTINTLIINLALADLMVTFFCMGSDVVWQSTVQWYAGDLMCKGVKFAQVFALNLSTYITVMISLDRCFAIMDPIRRNKAPKRVKIMIILSWCFCSFISIPQIFIFKVVKGPFKEHFVQCMDMGYMEVAWSKRVYSIVSLLFSFVLPLLIMGVAYGLISGTITRKSKDFRDHDESSIMSEHSQFRGQVRSHLFRKAKRKALRMSIVIVAAFIICWTPYYVVFMYTTFLDLPEFSRKTMLALSFIGLSNSLLNPMIYGAFHLCKVHSPSRCWRRKEWPSYSLRTRRTVRNTINEDHIVVLNPKNVVVLCPDGEELSSKDKINQQCVIVLYKVNQGGKYNENINMLETTSSG